MVTWWDGLKLRPMALGAMLQLSYSLRMLVGKLFGRHFSKITAPRILTKLGQKLEGDE